MRWDSLVPVAYMPLLSFLIHSFLLLLHLFPPPMSPLLPQLFPSPHLISSPHLLSSHLISSPPFSFPLLSSPLLSSPLLSSPHLTSPPHLTSSPLLSSPPLQSLKAPDLKDRLEESEKLIQEMTVTWEEKLRKTEEIAQVTHAHTRTAAHTHIINNAVFIVYLIFMEILFYIGYFSVALSTLSMLQECHGPDPPGYTIRFML